MEESPPSADPADSTAITVILVPILVIEQVTHQAGIPSESHSAFFTLGLYPLSRVTLRTDQLRYRLTIEKVGFVFVMAVSTHVELVAAWCHKLGPSLVVCTSDSFLSLVWLFLGLLLLGCSHLFPVPLLWVDSLPGLEETLAPVVVSSETDLQMFHNFRH